jgi:triosephosphate isomerase
MLKSLRVAYVIIGHSERRIYFRETDEMINKKLKAALSAGLIPILCVGEKQGENAKKVIGRQLNKDLAGIKNLKLKIKNLIIAYEPVWAIGTGDFCPAEKAGRVCQFIRDIQNSKFKIQNSTILYGGSVNSKIAKDYINIGFDGLLVGGASLNAEEFIKIVRPV